jgi:hypothetical protein
MRRVPRGRRRALPTANRGGTFFPSPNTAAKNSAGETKARLVQGANSLTCSAERKCRSFGSRSGAICRRTCEQISSRWPIRRAQSGLELGLFGPNIPGARFERCFILDGASAPAIQPLGLAVDISKPLAIEQDALTLNHHRQDLAVALYPKAETRGAAKDRKAVVRLGPLPRFLCG